MGVRLEQVKAPLTLLFLLRFNHFSLIIISWIIAKLALTSRILKRLILTVFVSAVYFCRESDIWRPLTLLFQKSPCMFFVVFFFYSSYQLNVWQDLIRSEITDHFFIVTNQFQLGFKLQEKVHCLVYSSIYEEL